MDVSQSNKIEKVYYSSKETCAKINDDLNLKSIDYISNFHLHDWKKKEWIKFHKTPKGKIHIDDLNEIKSFVYFHVKLGVKGSRIKEIKEYLKDSAELNKFLYEDTKQ